GGGPQQLLGRERLAGDLDQRPAQERQEPAGAELDAGDAAGAAVDVGEALLPDAGHREPSPVEHEVDAGVRQERDRPLAPRRQLPGHQPVALDEAGQVGGGREAVEAVADVPGVRLGPGTHPEDAVLAGGGDVRIGHPTRMPRGPDGQRRCRCISSSHRIRASRGGRVESSRSICSPARNGLAIIRWDCETSGGSGGSGASWAPRWSLRSADASARGSPVSSEPLASAWNSRDRLTAICTMAAAIGPSSEISSRAIGLGRSSSLPPNSPANIAMLARKLTIEASAPATDEMRMSRL